jgi:hypothetical protein
LREDEMTGAGWSTGEGQGEGEAEREEAYRRLAAAVRRAGLPMERLHQLLAQVAHNETETRRFLADEVYGISDDLLDDLIRLRLSDSAREDQK